MVVKKEHALVKKITDEKKQLNEIVDLDDKFNLNVFEALSYREKTTADYNRIYYIYEGVMSLHIKDQEFRLQKGDACLVEKGSTFVLEGTFNVIIVSQPVLRV